MFGLRMMHIHDPEKHYLVRVCMLRGEFASEDVAPDSEIRQCAECERDIWYHTTQVPPTVPDVEIADGEVLLCLGCTVLHQVVGEDEPKWIGPTPGDLPI
jgi:hypothetical protein